MELIRISAGKLKVMLTPEDVERFHLDPASETPMGLHDSFRSLLCEIERKSGFDAGAKELSIQYFPSREGGCEMFISHLSETEEKKSKNTSLATKETTGFHKEYAFHFFRNGTSPCRLQTSFSNGIHRRKPSLYRRKELLFPFARRSVRASL